MQKKCIKNTHHQIYTVHKDFCEFISVFLSLLGGQEEYILSYETVTQQEGECLLLLWIYFIVVNITSFNCVGV